MSSQKKSEPGKVRHLSGKFERLARNGVSGIQDGGERTVNDNSKTLEKHNTDSEEEKWVCSICSNIFKDDKDKVLECDFCHKHTCAKCLKLMNAQYTTTQREDLL